MLLLRRDIDLLLLLRRRDFERSENNTVLGWVGADRNRNWAVEIINHRKFIHHQHSPRNSEEGIDSGKLTIQMMDK